MLVNKEAFTSNMKFTFTFGFALCWISSNLRKWNPLRFKFASKCFSQQTGRELVFKCITLNDQRWKLMWLNLISIKWNRMTMIFGQHYMQKSSSAYLQCRALHLVVPENLVICIEELGLIYIARFSGTTKCSAWHCAVPGTANSCAQKPGYIYSRA